MLFRSHAILHLLYARFFTKGLRDLGLTGISEPFARLLTQGMVIKDGAKMSKSLGNTVDPGEIIDRFSADTARLFILFASPPEKELEWNDQGVEGAFRFLNRVYRMIADHREFFLSQAPAPDSADDEMRSLLIATHRAIRKVTEDIEKRFQFNTAISAIMELVNELHRVLAGGGTLSSGGRWTVLNALRALILLIAPFAPHLAEELWEVAGQPYSVFQQSWPEYDPELTLSQSVQIVVQINGKVRARFDAPPDSSRDELGSIALAIPRVRELIAEKKLIKKVVVPGKLVSLVVR